MSRDGHQARDVRCVRAHRGPVEGLIHVSELVDRRIAHPKEVVREGDLLPLKIVRIERDRHRLA